MIQPIYTIVFWKPTETGMVVPSSNFSFITLATLKYLFKLHKDGAIFYHLEVSPFASKYRSDFPLLLSKVYRIRSCQRFLQVAREFREKYRYVTRYYEKSL